MWPSSLAWRWWSSSLGCQFTDCPKHLHEHAWEQVRLWWIIVVRNHVFRRQRVENVLSNDGAEMGRHVIVWWHFQLLWKRVFVCGYSWDIFAAMSYTVLQGELLLQTFLAAFPVSPCQNAGEGAGNPHSCPFLSAMMTTFSRRAAVFMSFCCNTPSTPTSHGTGWLNIVAEQKCPGTALTTLILLLFKRGIVASARCHIIWRISPMWTMNSLRRSPKNNLILNEGFSPPASSSSSQKLLKML